VTRKSEKFFFDFRLEKEASALLQSTQSDPETLPGYYSMKPGARLLSGKAAGGLKLTTIPSTL